MLMLYSVATGQKMPLSATTPQSASLGEMGGRLRIALRGVVRWSSGSAPVSAPSAKEAGELKDGRTCDEVRQE